MKNLVYKNHLQNINIKTNIRCQILFSLNLQYNYQVFKMRFLESCNDTSIRKCDYTQYEYEIKKKFAPI